LASLFFNESELFFLLFLLLNKLTIPYTGITQFSLFWFRTFIDKFSKHSMSFIMILIRKKEYINYIKYIIYVNNTKSIYTQLLARKKKLFLNKEAT
jgi:hypothetical protein